MHVLEARTRQPEVVEAVIELDPRDSHRQITHLSKIRQSHPPRLLHLAEDHFPILPVQGAPLADPPFHRPAYAVRQLWMAPLHLLEHRNCPQTRRRLQHRHDLGIKNTHQRIRSAPPAG
jgi:hypothetical protein